MNGVNLQALYEKLCEKVSTDVLPQIQVNLLGASGLQIKIDMEKSLTSISVWPNGCCDVDFLYAKSERGKFKHYEFTSTEQSFEVLVGEIYSAIEQGNAGNKA